MVCTHAVAQKTQDAGQQGRHEAPVSEQSYRYADETQLWRLTDNAAGLAIDRHDSAAANRGVAFFNLQHQSGDYHRVQEGNQQNSLRFFTERYQKIGKYLYGYGSFDFDMGRIKERAWSDVMRTYNSNPFISGSSISGKYDFLNFALRAKLASIRLGHFNYGAELYYKVGDLSRLRDPRSRQRMAEYRLTPSAVYTTGRHHVGLSAFYHRYKEKNSMTTAASNPDITYYEMSGLENAVGTFRGYSSYWREYVNHEFGAELSYAYRSKTFHSVNTLNYKNGTEFAYGIHKKEPGTYYTRQYGLTTRNRIERQRLIHSIDVTLNYEEAYADQFSQEEHTETNEVGNTTQYWVTTMTFPKRYQLQKTDLAAHYRLSFTDRQAVRGFVGMTYRFHHVSNKHIPPTSQLKYGASQLGVEGGYGFFGHRLWVTANANLNIHGTADLSLHNAQAVMAQQVLIPDMDYYEANYFQGRLQLTYQMPITIKRQTNHWFAGIYGEYLTTNNSLNGKTVGVSVGLYY